MTDYAELLNIAEAAISEANAYRNGVGDDPDAMKNFTIAATPEVVLGLLDEIEAVRRANFDCMDNFQQIRERAEIASAHAALRYFVNSLSEFHGGEHHDETCPDCRAMIEHSAAIEAARKSG